ncbi:hypothetical protein OS493_006502 [Desmophyllum pertusum]|uniref:Uncharacterized protein n=1 Tax=Desmophyllum pertusum TaxID=174260 RepID=A0A9X0A5L9_9CNID|nr:hypothetical protein OS493_006502 [Desmophyllum pertusum]
MAFKLFLVFVVLAVVVMNLSGRCQAQRYECLISPSHCKQGDDTDKSDRFADEGLRLSERRRNKLRLKLEDILRGKY